MPRPFSCPGADLCTSQVLHTNDVPATERSYPFWWKQLPPYGVDNALVAGLLSLGSAPAPLGSRSPINIVNGVLGTYVSILQGVAHEEAGRCAGNGDCCPEPGDRVLGCRQWRG